ncbi:hypothetical protein QF050_002690 [Arthrobacter sp. SLBN-112]|nr:hypothetical protein [Arthrobacter sp. SLBN-112]
MGRGTEAQLVRQRLGSLLGEATRDLRAPVGDHSQGTRGGNDLIVQHNGELGLWIGARFAARCHVELVQALGDVLELGRAFGVELDVDGPVIGDRTLRALLQLEGRGDDVGALDLYRAQNVLDGRGFRGGGFAGYQWLGGIGAL